MDETQRRRIVIEELVAVARESLARWNEAARQQKHWQAIQSEENERLDRLQASAADLGFNLEVEARAIIAREEAEQTAPTKQSLVAEEFGVARSVPTIKQFVLVEAEAAFPKPIRSAELRKVFKERYGRELHYKTVGMTLYRLSESHFVRREGQADWYFIPEPERLERIRKTRETLDEIMDQLFAEDPPPP